MPASIPDPSPGNQPAAPAPASAPAPAANSGPAAPPLFGASTHRGPQEKRNWIPVIAAVSVALIGLVLVVLLGHRASTPVNQNAAAAPAPPDPYAGKLELSNIHMSEASNFAGGKVTYLDGTIRNLGDKTVTAVQVQVTFSNDVGELPQRMTVPLNLIRAHEPYIDTEHVAADPLKPSDAKEFRLTFEGITPIWNQAMPQGQVVHVETR